MRIGGVSSTNNTTDILTKTLPPPLHAKHCAPLHILSPTIITHTTTLHNMAVFAQKKEPLKPTKQQKRRAKRQRKRERDYRLLAHARSTLKQHYHLDNTKTANLSTLLAQMHNDRHLFHWQRTQPPPQTSQHTSGTHHLQPPMHCTPIPTRTQPTKQKRHTHTPPTHTTPRSDPRLTPVNNKRMTQQTARRREAKTISISIFTKQQKTKIQKFSPNNNPPVNTKTKSKRENDKKTQKPNRN
jgi:hypothetical protein